MPEYTILVLDTSEFFDSFFWSQNLLNLPWTVVDPLPVIMDHGITALTSLLRAQHRSAGQQWQLQLPPHHNFQNSGDSPWQYTNG